jgi:hypothetical protein
MTDEEKQAIADRIKAEYDAVARVAYEQAKQSGLPDDICEQLAEMAQARKAVEEIQKVFSRFIPKS